MSKSGNDPYVWVGGNIAIDLVNTEIISRGKHQDLLQNVDDIVLWWEATQVHHPNIDRVDGINSLICNLDLLKSVKELRSSLRGLFQDITEDKEPSNESIAHLNKTLERGHPILVWENNQPRHSYRYLDDPYAPLLLPIALSTLDLITKGELERLHRCHNNDCVLMFYDTTKNGNRRWCTTACMDRERSAHRYREMKAKAKE